MDPPEEEAYAGLVEQRGLDEKSWIQRRIANEYELMVVVE